MHLNFEQSIIQSGVCSYSKGTTMLDRPYDVTALYHSCPLDGVFLLRRNLNRTQSRARILCVTSETVLPDLLI